MKGVIINNFGEVQIDPHNCKAKHDKWISQVVTNGDTNYHTMKKVSEQASELITRYILDLHNGKNLAKGTRRGKRSFNHLCNTRIRLHKLAEMLETRYNKKIMELTEDNILNTFAEMRDGTILTREGKPHLCVSSYAKAFGAFWRWIVRTQKKENIILPDLCESLDTSQDRKPKWSYFTIQDVEAMARVAPSFYYEALVYFLFDSGVRAPSELMNVRAMDITPVPNTNYVFLNVRNETSKTFGRKIKLMICSEKLMQFIKMNDLKGQDFLFPIDYVTTRRVVAKMGYNALKLGMPHTQKSQKILISNGISLYDFRHNSCCHYLPIYKSANQMMYRYGWKKSEMIHYYSEFMGMKDTITDDDMLIDTTKTELERQLQREQQRVAILEEQLNAQKKETEERLKQIEKIMLQKFANTF